ncbi:GNAT family N-acetyltransferase [Lysinibacillus sp. SGAir0095]|uniref:GNAT family N-acetyltransferase n=1 Tax=Lysinibacillus sp. SGAir0095 TaxID=2070463 RepID=UPI0010CD13DE|nr:GNAT family N-acetyltransferase [Lysinibacillus sp. SGAir0095]QCR33092.1 GNAT family N-acetyltransferase [Lysinibacillus sp. SGAir0095]
MNKNLVIERLNSIEDHIEELSELLIRVVEDGASIGFLPPLQLSDAKKYWENVLSPDVLLYVAKKNNQIVGSIQLHLSAKPNGRHRAEIAKLMTDTNFRRNGIGRSLMKKAEEQAIQQGRSLIVLDTREGDPSNLLYTSMGYIEAGKIPNYAESSDGLFHSTVYYYKMIAD